MSSPPIHDLQAERAVLAAVLLAPEQWESVDHLLTSEAFWEPRHRVIWDSFVATSAAGKPIDVVTVSSYMRALNTGESVPDMTYLAELADATPYTRHAEHHAGIVSALALQRAISSVCERVGAEGRLPVPNVQEWADTSEQSISQACSSALGGVQLAKMHDSAAEAMREIEALQRGETGAFTPTHSRFLDSKLGGGWRHAKAHVIAGRPGMGKSILAAQQVLFAARRGEPGVIVSLEMTEAELVLRMVATISGLSQDKIMSGQLTASELAKVADGMVSLSNIPLSIQFVPPCAVSKVRAIAKLAMMDLRRRFDIPKEKKGITAVDYLQLMTGDDDENKRVSRNMLALTQFAGETGVPVIVVSQLNRVVETRASKQPTMSDLRGSGGIEQDAYSICLIYRAGYYEDQSNTGEADLIFGKSRGKGAFTAPQYFDGPHSMFKDLEINTGYADHELPGSDGLGQFGDDFGATDYD